MVVIVFYKNDYEKVRFTLDEVVFSLFIRVFMMHPDFNDYTIDELYVMKEFVEKFWDLCIRHGYVSKDIDVIPDKMTTT